MIQRRGRFVTVCAVLAAGVQAAAQLVAQPSKTRDSFWVFSEDPVAYCAFDASALRNADERSPAIIAAGVRGLLDNLASIEGGSSIADEVLRARVLGDSAWRVVLLELAGETVETKGNGSKRDVTRTLKPSKFAAVIEVLAPAKDGGHDRLLAAIEAGLAKDAKGEPRDRRDLPLSGGLKGTLSSGGTEWRDVSWVSKPDSFIVAFGKGTLEKYLALRPARRADWWEQRATVDKKRGRGEYVFEAFVDLSALRRGVPDEFAGGRLDKLVHAWRIANDRTFMVHAVLMGGKAKKDEGAETSNIDEPAPGERLLAIDLSWTSRAEKPGLVHTVSVSESKKPEGKAEGKAKSDGWVVMMRAGLPSWIAMGLDTYEALGPAEFDAVRGRWERRVAPMLERIVPRIGEWVSVRPGPEVTISLKAAEGQDRLAADLRALFSTMAPVVTAAGKGWGLDAGGVEDELKGLAWRVEGGSVVTEWRERKK